MRNGADTIIRAFESACSLWQGGIKLLNGKHEFEAIRIGKAVFLVQHYPGGDGWEVFAPVCDEGRIDATLAAIAKRAGVELPTAEALKALGVEVSIEWPGHSEEPLEHDPNARDKDLCRYVG